MANVHEIWLAVSLIQFQVFARMLLLSMYLFFIQCSLKAVQEEPLLLGVLRLDVVSDLSAWQLVLSILDEGFVFDHGVDF